MRVNEHDLQDVHAKTINGLQQKCRSPFFIAGTVGALVEKAASLRSLPLSLFAVLLRVR